MFTRRHPYLFFLIVMAGLATLGTIFLSIMVIAVSDKEKAYDGEKVGVIEIIGTIGDSRQVIDQLKEFREQNAIKAIVIRVDSPGGAVGPSQEIYREIRKTTPEKSVIISMGAVAASGGYYVAAAGDGIVANPGTLTGSIGVIMGFTNVEALMSKIGLTPVVIKSGEYKDIGSSTRDMTAEERKLLEAVAHNIHRQFVSDIADGRGLEIAQVETIADGRIFTGEDAKTYGLVDRLGNLEDAIQWAGELGGIEGAAEAYYPEKEQLSFIQYLMESAMHLWRQDRMKSHIRPEAILH